MDVVPTPLESPKAVKVGLRNLKDATRMNGVTEDTLSSALMLVDNLIQRVIYTSLDPKTVKPLSTSLSI